MNVQGYEEANIITTLTYDGDASSGTTTIPMCVVQDVAIAIRFAPADEGQSLQIVARCLACTGRAGASIGCELEVHQKDLCQPGTMRE